MFASVNRFSSGISSHILSAAAVKAKQAETLKVSAPVVPVYPPPSRQKDDGSPGKCAFALQLTSAQPGDPQELTGHQGNIIPTACSGMSQNT